MEWLKDWWGVLTGILSGLVVAAISIAGYIWKDQEMHTKHKIRLDNLEQQMIQERKERDLSRQRQEDKLDEIQKDTRETRDAMIKTTTFLETLHGTKL